MRPTSFIVIALSIVLALAAHAQDLIITNAPATEIENFEMQNDVIIVKGYDEIGSVTTGEGVISVRCKESDNVTAGSKQYGIAIAFNANQGHAASIVDYDELESLVHGLDFLSKISYNVTTMPTFDAGLTTRSGFRIAAHSERRQGAIQLFLQFGTIARIPLTADQFAQFQNLITQAKASLDVTRNKNSSP
jgi:hypothetical protein